MAAKRGTASAYRVGVRVYRESSRSRVGHVQLSHLALISFVALAGIGGFGALGEAFEKDIAARAPLGRAEVGQTSQAAGAWVRSVAKVLSNRHGAGVLVQNAEEFIVSGSELVRGRRRVYEVTGLPWWEHLQNKDTSRARRLQIVDRGERQIRHRVTDGPFADDGSFTRRIEVEDLLYHQAPKPVPPSSADAPFVFSAKRMGPQYDPDKGELSLRVFAPRHEAELVLHPFGAALEERIAMTMDHAGVWETVLKRDQTELTGRSYSFALRDRIGGEETLVADPYAHAVTEDVTRSRIADLRYDWRSEPGRIAPIGERVMFETHVRDLTRDSSSPFPAPLRGSYSAAADPRTARMARGGVPEFMPIHEYDPFFGGHWGYSTTDFFAPSLRYAVDEAAHPRGLGPEQQFMELVDAHRAEGRPVVIDVVYNHTSNDPSLYFHVAGQDLYYRIEVGENGDAFLRNGSGTGNEFASEHPMARKLIVDSLKHFVENYRIDGFRFDLGALIDIPTLRSIDKALPEHVFLTMEPWSWQHARFGKDIVDTGALRETRWTVWNDDARDLFEHIHRHGANDEREIWSLQKVITGSVADSPTAPGQKPGFTSRPNQSVNLIGTHDEGALAHGSTPQRMAMTATLGITSQGTPLLQPLMTALHGKDGIGNTWNLDTPVNWLNWNQRKANAAFEEYITSLAEYRASRSHFHYERPLTDADIEWLHPRGSGVGYRLEPSRASGPQKPVVVLTNLSQNPSELARYTLPDGDWNVVFDGETLEVGPIQGRVARGEYYVRPGTAVVLEQR